MKILRFIPTFFNTIVPKQQSIIIDRFPSNYTTIKTKIITTEIKLSNTPIVSIMNDENKVIPIYKS